MATKATSEPLRCGSTPAVNSQAVANAGIHAHIA
jgi:hypothetical protein